MRKGTVNFESIGVMTSDDTFRRTWEATLVLLVLGLKENMHSFKHGTKEEKNILVDRNALKEHICSVINRSVNAVNSIYQKGKVDERLPENRSYLYVKPKDIFIDEENNTFIDDEHGNDDCFHHLLVDEVENNLLCLTVSY